MSRPMHGSAEQHNKHISSFDFLADALHFDDKPSISIHSAAREKDNSEGASTPNVNTDNYIMGHREAVSDVERIPNSTPLSIDSSPTLIPDAETPRSNPNPPSEPRLLSEDMSKTREIAFLFMISMLSVFPQAVLTNVFPSSQVIGNDFNITDLGTLPWIIAAYSLTLGTFILISGRLGDIFGHKNLVVIGFCWLGFWSLIAGLSVYSNFVLFFFARAFQGIGCALLQPNGLALLGRTYAPGSKKKNMAFALFGSMAPFGAWMGMLFGAIFAQLSWWPWMFFVLCMVSLLMAVLSQLIFISPPPTPKMLRPVKEKILDMDWYGAVTGVTALVCINIAWNVAPAAGWSTQYVYMLLIVGFVFLGGFCLVEMKIASQPLLPFHALKSDVTYVLAAVACGWGCFGVWVYYFWQFLLNIRHLTPLMATAQFFPVVPLGFVAAGLTGFLMHTTRPTWILTWALLAFTIGAILLALAPPGQTYWALTFVSLLIMPFGMDMSFPASTVIMSNAVPREHQGIAGSLISTVVNYSISLGLGFAGTVEVHVNEGGTTEESILKGYRGAWYMGIGLGALGCLITISFLLRGYLHEWKEKRAADAEENHCELCGYSKRNSWRTSGMIADMMGPREKGLSQNSLRLQTPSRCITPASESYEMR